MSTKTAEPKVTQRLATGRGISAEEYARVKEILGRVPNYTELEVAAALWSEHCSYKSSKVHLKGLPTRGADVLQGPGENAGIVDIGNGIETEGDSSHVELGVELGKRIGEDPRVINAIAAHHRDVPHNCVESVIVQVADAISASRPGARRETLDNYIKRLENLEAIAEEFDGVEKAFAIQAGRELRIMVNHEKVSDQQAKEIARKIAHRIEEQLRYPGRIKITMIRETRIVEYAR